MVSFLILEELETIAETVTVVQKRILVAPSFLPSAGAAYEVAAISYETLWLPPDL